MRVGWHSPFKLVAMFVWVCAGGLIGYHVTKSIFRNSIKRYYTGLCIPVPSQLNIPVWRTLLQDYEDSVICDFLEFGWPLGYTNQTLPVFHLRTHRGTLNFPSAVQDYLNSLSSRIDIKSALSCTMHGIRSCASFFSWLLAKGNPSLYPHVPSNHSLYILWL